MSENEMNPVAFDGSELRHGCVLRPKRWSGDTHDDLGGSVDEAATEVLMAAAADEIDRLKAERDDALAAADSKAGWEWKKLAEKAEADARRWNELCRQVDLTMFPYAILDDAMAMGAGALELYIDEAMKEQEQCK